MISNLKIVHNNFQKLLLVALICSINKFYFLSGAKLFLFGCGDGRRVGGEGGGGGDAAFWSYIGIINKQKGNKPKTTLILLSKKTYYAMLKIFRF